MRLILSFRLCVRLVALLFFANLSSFAQKKYPSDSIALINCTVLDPASESRFEKTTILIHDGLIQMIEPGGEVPLGYSRHDLSGFFVVPGMIDAHTHISTLESARIALESGVTTVRSASVPAFQDVTIRHLVGQGVLPGPDMKATGIFVTPELGETILADPRLDRLSSGVNSEEELRHLVRVNIDRGVDFIKTRGTERAGLPETDPRKQTYTEVQLRTIVEEASAANIPVMVHAHGDEGGRAAVLAGARSIEHGTFLSRATLQLMSEKGVFLVPTYITLVDLTEPGGDYDNPAIQIRGKYMIPKSEEAIKNAIALGVKIVTGADNRYTKSSTSRVSMEAEHYVRLGMSTWEALRSTTSNAAELLGINGLSGSIVVGLEADLVVLPGDPLEDIRALQDVVMVLSNGHLVLNRLPFGKN